LNGILDHQHAYLDRSAAMLQRSEFNSFALEVNILHSIAFYGLTHLC